MKGKMTNKKIRSFFSRYANHDNIQCRQAVMKSDSSFSLTRNRLSFAALNSLVGGSLVVGSLLTPQQLCALPQDGQVTAGSANISQTSSIRLDVNQATSKAVIDWRSFNIAPNEITNFNQPSVSSVILNRVLAADPSRILGTMTANGTVMLVNPNGILFGPSARIDVGGLVATTANITNRDFLADSYNFNLASGNFDASIINEGNITIRETGLAALVAPVVANSGVIQARLGTVTLAAGKTFTLDLYGDQLVSFDAGSIISEELLADAEVLVSNSGLISADGGTVLLTASTAGRMVNNAVNMDGIIEARTANVADNGEIILHGGDGGTVQVAGTLDVSGYDSGQNGGTVQVLGDEVILAESAHIDASGDLGGGEILVGGDLQGGNPDIMNASQTSVAAGAVIAADAVSQGDGGKVIVWADETTSYHGDISARGGALAGDGGFAEVSGKAQLDFGGAVDLTAAHGETGSLLLDPDSILIRESDPDINGDGTPGPDISDPGDLDDAYDDFYGVASVITDDAVEDLLSLTNLTLDAEFSIDVEASIDRTDSNTLTLSAFQINLSAPIQGNVQGDADVSNVFVLAGGLVDNGVAIGSTGFGGLHLDISLVPGADTIDINDLGNIGRLIGDGTDILQLTNNDDVVSIHGTSVGVVDGVVEFAGFGLLEGMGGNDFFSFSGGLNTINIDGGSHDPGNGDVVSIADVPNDGGANNILDLATLTNIEGVLGDLEVGDTLQLTGLGEEVLISDENFGAILTGGNTVFLYFDTVLGMGGGDLFWFGPAGELDSIDGGGGSDTVRLDATDDLVDITGANSGTVAVDGILLTDFSNIERLEGGAGADTFYYEDGIGSLEIDGGLNPVDGRDIVDITMAGGGNTLDLAQHTNMELLVGNKDVSNGDTLLLTDNNDTVTITGAFDGTANGVEFRDFVALQGIGGDDSFTFIYSGDPDASVPRLDSVDGGTQSAAGRDTIQLTSIPVDLINYEVEIDGNNSGSIATSVGTNILPDFSNIEGIQGGSGDDVFHYTGGVGSIDVDGGPAGYDIADVSDAAGNVTLSLVQHTNIDEVIGSSDGGDTLALTPGDDVVTVTGINDGIVNTVVSFTDFGTVSGIGGGNTFSFELGGSLEAVNGGADFDIIDISAIPGVDILDFENNDIDPLVGSFSSIEGFTGDNSDTIVMTNGPDEVDVDAFNAGTANGAEFFGFSSVSGLAGNDLFIFGAKGSLVAIDGGNDTDTMRLSDQLDDTIIIDGVNSGTVPDIPLLFSSIESVESSGGDDTFIFHAGGSLVTVDGGNDTDTIDISLAGGGSHVDFEASTIAGIVGTFISIEQFIGAATDSIWGTDGDDIVNVTGVNSGDINGNDFSGFTTIETFAGNDSFTFAAGGTLVLADAGADSDVIELPDTPDTVTVNGDNSGNVAGILAGFLGVERIEGNGGNDTFTYNVTTDDLTTTIGGGGGDDTLIIDFQGVAAPGGQLVFAGGGQTNSDSITMNDSGGTTYSNVNHSFINNSDGTIDVDGMVISYTGLEPINDNLSANDRVFDFGFDQLGENITIADIGGADGLSNIDSDTGGESVTFRNPLVSLTVNAGVLDDTVDIQGLDAGFDADFTVNGDGGTDTVMLTGILPLTVEDVNIDAETVNFVADIDIDGILTITNANQVDLANVVADGAVSVTGGNIDLNANNYQSNTGAVSFNGAVDLMSGGGLSVVSGGGIADNIFFSSTIDDPGSDSALVLTSGAGAGAGAVTVTGPAGSVQDLGSFTVLSTGQVDLDDVLADGVISVTGADIDLNGNTYQSSLSSLEFFGAVSLDSIGLITVTSGGDVGDDIFFSDTVDDTGSNSDLELTAGNGTVTITGNAGSPGSFSSFTVVSAGQVNLANVTSNGAISVTGDNIDLNGNSYVSNNSFVDFIGGVELESTGLLTVETGGGLGDNILFSAAIDDPGNDSDLELIAGSGSVTVAGNAGSVQPLRSFTVSSAAQVDIANVITQENIFVNGDNIDLNGILYQSNFGQLDFNGPVDLDSTGTVHVTSGGGGGDDITFTGTIDDTASDSDLIVTAGNGNVQVADNVGSASPLGSFVIASASQVDLVDVTANGVISVTGGNIDLNGNSYVSNDSSVSFNGSVDLDSAGLLVVRSGGGAGDNILFDGTIDDTGNNSDLVLTAGSGTVTVVGDTGSNQPLSSFTVGSASMVDIANVTTNGNIDVTGSQIALRGNDYSSNNSSIFFNGVVDLVSAGTLLVESGGGSGDNILFTSAIDDPGSNSHLVLSAGSGSVTVGGNAGAGQALGSFTVTHGSQVSIDDVIANGEVTVNGGNINLNGRRYISNGSSIEFNGSVDLSSSGNLLVQSGGGSGDHILFSSSIDDSGSNSDLLLSAGSGSVTAVGNAGSGQAIGSFTVENASQVDVNDVLATGPISITGGNIDLNGGRYQSSSSSIDFLGSVDLNSTGLIDVTSGGGQGDNIFFSSRVDDSGSNSDLVLTAGAGTVTLSGNAGSSSPLNTFTVASGSQVDLADVTADGVISVTGDNIDLNGSMYRSSIGSVTFDGAVDLDSSGEVNVASGGGTGDTIFFSSTLDDTGSDSDLTLTAGSGNVEIVGNTGTANALGSFTVASGNQIDLADVTAVGALSVTGTNIDLNGSMYQSNSGSVTFNGAVDLDSSGDVNVASGGGTGDTIFFSSTLDDTGSDSDLILTGGSGNVEIVGNAGTANALGSFTVASGSQIDLADVTAVGALSVTGTNIDLNGSMYQSNSGSVTFNGAVDLDSSGTVAVASGGGTGDTILFSSTLDDTGSDSDLILTGGSGNVEIVGNTGTANALASFTVAGGSQIDLADVTADGALSVTGGNIDLNGSMYQSNSDSVTFNGPVDLDSSGTVAVASGGEEEDNITFNSTLDDTGSDSDLELTAGQGRVALSGAAGSSGPLQSITVNSASWAEIASLRANSIRISADEIDLVGGAGSIFGGTILLQPFTPSQNMVLADVADNGAGSLDLSVSDLGTLADGFSNISLGRENGSGEIDIPNNNFEWNDPVTINVPTQGITIGQPPVPDGEDSTAMQEAFTGLRATGDGSFTFVYQGSSPFADDVPGGTTMQLNSNIITEGGDIVIDPDIDLDLGDDLVISLATFGGDIDLGSALGQRTHLQLLADPNNEDNISEGGSISADCDVCRLSLSGSSGSLTASIRCVANDTLETGMFAAMSVFTYPAPHDGSLFVNGIRVTGLGIDRTAIDVENYFYIPSLPGGIILAGNLLSVESLAVPEGYSLECDPEVDEDCIEGIADEEEAEKEEDEASETTPSESGFGLTE